MNLPEKGRERDPGGALVPEPYTRTAVALHWIMALLIAAGFTLGATMVDLTVSPLKVRVFNYHKWIGMTVLGLALVRVLWRAIHAAPREVPMPRWQRLAAQATHALLYSLILAGSLVGWLYTSAAGYPVVYLRLWQLPDLVHKSPELARTLKLLHATLSWSLLGLVVLHVAAALKHHFVDRDSTLRRMLSWRRS